MQDLTALQRDEQNLMRDIKTQHADSQVFMAEWKKDTMQLSRALRSSYQQGIWGEHELKRVVELAGMQDHCDFEVQQRLPNGQTADMVIYMHNHRAIIVDSKAPSQAYLDAVDCEDEATRTARLKAYAHNVRDIMNKLAKKEYWKQIQPTLALVILFIPNEAMFRAALQHDAGLLELAAEKNVLLASPVTMIALLKALAYGWSQEERAQHVQQIVDQSKELHKELETWLQQWQPVKKAIQNASTEYNRVVNRYHTHILPLLQALGALDSTLVIKDKTFDLKPIPNSETTELPLLKPEQELLNVQGPSQETFTVSKSEGISTSWQDRLTQPLKTLQTLLPPGWFSQEQENGS
jgi:DNA recombination protein RmuC